MGSIELYCMASAKYEFDWAVLFFRTHILIYDPFLIG